LLLFNAPEALKVLEFWLVDIDAAVPPQSGDSTVGLETDMGPHPTGHLYLSSSSIISISIRQPALHPNLSGWETQTIQATHSPNRRQL
jgi:hypothetical protein